MRRALLALLAAAALSGAAVVSCRSVSGRAAPTAAPFAGRVPDAVPLPAKVVIYGDSRPTSRLEFWRDDPGPVRRKVAEAVAAERPAFVVHAGDLVLDGDEEDDWQLFDRETAAIRDAGIPFLPIPGNHEQARDASRARALFLARFPDRAASRWEQVRAGPLVVLTLDTNEEDLAREQVAEQDRWLAARLAALDEDASARWVVLVGHHPAMTNAVVHSPDEFAVEHAYRPMLASRKARAYVAAHVHAYERFSMGGRWVVVSGGGGAPRVDVEAGRRAKDLYPGGRTRPFHYLRLTVEADRCRVEAVMLDEARGTWFVGDRFDL